MIPLEAEARRTSDSVMDQAGENGQAEIQPQRGEHDEDRVENAERALQHVLRIDFARHEVDQDAGNARFDERVQVPERARHGLSPAQPAADQVPEGELVTQQQGNDRDDVDEHGRREEPQQLVNAGQRVAQDVERDQRTQQSCEDRHAHALALDDLAGEMILERCSRLAHGLLYFAPMELRHFRQRIGKSIHPRLRRAA